MNYYIADLHFGHKNALQYNNDNRFENIEEYDLTIIKNWNNIVGIDDDVYILGDISWHNSTKTIEIFKNLNGNKHLIIGNHDKRLLKNKQLRDLFVEITDYKELNYGRDLFMVLSHYPIPCFNKHYYGAYHLYGHVHNSKEWHFMEEVREKMQKEYGFPCLMYNVGVMMDYISYTPRTLDEIICGYNYNISEN